MKKTAVYAAFLAFLFALPAILACFFNIYVDFIYLGFLIVITAVSAAASFVFLLIVIDSPNNVKAKKIFVFFISFTCAAFIALCARINLQKALLGDLPIGSNYKKFDLRLWQDAPNSNAKNRQYMLKDLIKNNLPQKTKEQVKALLGKPDIEEERSLRYITGRERKLFSFDAELLIIDFDLNNIFEKCTAAQG